MNQEALIPTKAIGIISAQVRIIIELEIQEQFLIFKRLEPQLGR